MLIGWTLWSMNKNKTTRSDSSSSSLFSAQASSFTWLPPVDYWNTIFLHSAFLLAWDSAAMLRMVPSTQLKDCAFQMKRTLLHHLEVLFSYGCSFHLFYILWQDRCHLGNEQFDFVYATYQHYTKGPTELISDFFELFLLWIWHFIVFNLMCSIEITPLDTVCRDEATVS